MDVTHLIALELACHDFSTLDNVVDVGRAVRAEGEVKRPWLTSTVQPSHNFVASEQAKLLFQTKLNITVNDPKLQSLKRTLTSGSVRQRAMTMMPDVKTPSVKRGPMNLCIFGVNRKGTASFEAKTGA